MSAIDIAETTDAIEDMILMALCADTNDRYADWSDSVGKNSNRMGTIGRVDAFDYVGISEMRPKSAYTIMFDDEDVLTAATNDFLVTTPANIIQNQSEIIVLHKTSMKWVGFRRVHRWSRSIGFMKKPDAVYEVHSRIMHKSGLCDYMKGMVGLDAAGGRIPLSVRGLMTDDSAYVNAMMCASIIEHAHRSTAMLASISDGIELLFAVPLDDYKKRFIGREAPMLGSRKRAIVHWVAKHMRTSPRNKSHGVKKHTRGVENIVMDGLRINIRPNRDVYPFGPLPQ